MINPFQGVEDGKRLACWAAYVFDYRSQAPAWERKTETLQRPIKYLSHDLSGLAGGKSSVRVR